MLFWRARSQVGLVGLIALAVVTGCTPSVTPTASVDATSTPSSSPPPTQTPTATATPTWSAEQAAAIAAVGKFSAADDKIGADPSAFTEKQMTDLLKEFSGGEALSTTVRWHLLLKRNGYRLAGEMAIVSTVATKAVDDGRGVEVHVTQCQDQRLGKVMDKSGNPVAGDQFRIPEYNLRQFSVRKPKGDSTFRVFGFQTVNGRCP